MELMFIIFYVAWIIVNVMIASEKHRDMTGVVIGSIFLSPLTIYLYLLAVPVKNNSVAEHKVIETHEDTLIRICRLYKEGLLTKEEFERKKKLLVGGK